MRPGLAGSSGLMHLPASTRYQPRVTTAPLSSMPIAAITGCGVSLHQEKPTRSASFTASSSRGLRALQPVDRIGVVAGDHQQALHAGEAGLRGIIVGLLAEIGGEALFG